MQHASYHNYSSMPVYQLAHQPVENLVIWLMASKFSKATAFYMLNYTVKFKRKCAAPHKQTTLPVQGVLSQDEVDMLLSKPDQGIEHENRA